ncbi:hypothetical protein RRSWK_05127 [Rhodopirellula sp. SWK7]|nr:hypothetical protein RRSWK_05127 [Rhodopirellula sp. SWK7]
MLKPSDFNRPLIAPLPQPTSRTDWHPCSVSTRLIAFKQYSTELVGKLESQP